MLAARQFIRASPVYSVASEQGSRRPTTRAQLVWSIIMSLILIALFAVMMWSSYTDTSTDNGTNGGDSAPRGRATLVDTVLLILLMVSLLIPLLRRIYRYFKEQREAKQRKGKGREKAGAVMTDGVAMKQQCMCTCQPVGNVEADTNSDAEFSTDLSS